MFVGVCIFCVVRVYYMFGASVFGARSHFAFVLFTCVYVCHVRVVIVRVYVRMCMFMCMHAYSHHSHTHRTYPLHSHTHLAARDLSFVPMLFVFVLVVAAYSFSHVGARAHSFSCSLLARGDVGRARSRWFCSLLVVTLVLIVLFVFALVVR